MAHVTGKKMVGKDNVKRPSVGGKGIGDMEKNSKVRNKSKIPKALRYDLENALVNLCDVWFEEIKPHLIRNNIKLHVHENHAGGEGSKLPHGAPGCPHLDPGAASDQRHRRGASCADCCPTPRTASRVPCRRLHRHRSSPRRHRPSLSPKEQHCRSGQESSQRRTRKRRKARKQTQSEIRLRIPRLCNNFTLESKSNQVQRKVGRCQNNIIKAINNKCRTKDKYTQTEDCGIERKDDTNTLRSLYANERRQVSNYQSKLRNETVRRPLFQKDLVDIICKKHNKVLEVIYKSPSKSEISSVMNLIPVPEARDKNCKRKQKNRPWK
ncbi:unnamed protein product [Leptosia nina]|uniref:Uncharacterized protein n=1 Tax=Leptosia nina TaxID=320188 RepID=A0AAV1ISJ3_9NEOP